MTATTSRHDSEGGASPTLRPEHAGNIALTGACRVRHRAGNDPPASPRVDETRTRCLALFSSRKGAWHRSHRVPRGADPPLHATRQAAGAPSARSQLSPATPARPSRWGDAGTPAAIAAAEQKAGAPKRPQSEAGFCRSAKRLNRPAVLPSWWPRSTESPASSASSSARMVLARTFPSSTPH